MSIGETVAAGVVALFLLLTLLRLFATPLRLLLRLVLNTALGFLALFLLRFLPALSPGFSLVNALTVGVFGLPGLVLLVLLKLVFL